MKKKPARSERKSATKRSRRKSSTTSHAPTRGLYGWITHTELASSNPTATKAWCAKVLGWTFKPSFPIPGGGEYMLFAYSDQGGGGIRPTNPSETPGSSFSVPKILSRVGGHLRIEQECHPPQSRRYPFEQLHPFAGNRRLE